MFDETDDPSLEEDEWIETEPLTKLSTVGCVCAECKGVFPKRRFIWRGELLPKCSTCRGKENNRLAQRRWYARHKKMVEERETRHYTDQDKLVRSMHARVNRMCSMDKYRLRKMREQTEGMFEIPKRTQNAMAKREWRIEQCEEIKRQIERDVRAGEAKPVAYYFSGEG